MIAPMRTLLLLFLTCAFLTTATITIYTWGVPQPADPDVSVLASAPDMDWAGTLAAMLPGVALLGAVVSARLGRHRK